MTRTRTAGIFFLLMFVLAGSAAAQPKLDISVEPSTLRPLSVAGVRVDFDDNGEIFELDTLLLFDSSVFSSATLGCRNDPRDGVSVSCTTLRDTGGIRIRAVSTDGAAIGDATLLELLLTVAPTATPQTTQINIEAERYLDEAGAPVESTGSLTMPIEIIAGERDRAVQRTRSGLGDAVVVPYLTTLGGRESFFVLKNSSPYAKAIRLNLRDGANGTSLINVDIGGNAARAMNVYLKPGERARFRVSTSTEGIAVLETGACTLPVIPDGGLPLGAFAIPVKGVAAVEGFATALVMADLGDASAAILDSGDCGSLVGAFGPRGAWAQDPTNGTLAPLGPITGIFTVKGLEGRGPFGGGAVALRGFSAGNGHRAPWEDFTLNDGQTVARINGAEFDFGLGAAAVSAALMEVGKLLQLRSRGIEWVFTMPTKWLLTDPQNGVGIAPLPPFNEAFGTFGSCDPVTIFPSLSAIDQAFCFSLNVVPFDNRSLLDSMFATGSVDTIASSRGGIEFSGTGLTSLQQEVTLDGLPVIASAIPFRSGLTRRNSTVPLALPGTPVGKVGDDTQAGASVTINGRLIFVGAPGANGGRGAVFVFRRHGTVLVPEQTLEIPPGFTVAQFGAAIAADGDQVIIGAPGDPGPPPKGSEGGGQMQAALWERVTGQWNLKTPVVNQADPDDAFGASVSMEGDLFVVGAPGTDSGEGQDDNAGAVYVFNGGNATVVTPGTPAQAGQFGTAVAIKNGVMGVGSPLATVLGSSAGSVSMYNDLAGNLAPLGTLVDDEPQNGEAFGSTLAFNGTQMAIGAPGTNGGDNGEIANQGQVQVWSVDGDSATFEVMTLLSADDAGINGFFGEGIGLTDDGDLIVGAPGALGIFGTGALYEYTMTEEDLLFDEKSTPLDDGISGFGASVATDGEVIIIGAPETAAEAGAALSVVDAEVLFFDDFESKLLR